MLAAINEEQLGPPARRAQRCRHIGHGGSPIATETLRRAHDAFPDAELVHLYGATETAPIATTLPHEELLLDAPQARSCGQPAVGVEVAVRRADGARAARRRGRRGRHPRPQRDGRLLEQARADRARRSSTAGTAPATSATWTTRATSSSSTGPRT